MTAGRRKTPAIARSEATKQSIPGASPRRRITPLPREPCVYILANRRQGTLYTGVTSNLAERVFQHREGLTPGFTSRYGCNRLVFSNSQAG